MVKSKVGTVEPVTQPENGDWNHRSEISLTDDQKAVSQVVEEKREGELHVPDPEEDEQVPLEELHPTHEEKPVAQKYREKYSEYWGPETKKKARKLYKKRGDNE